MTSVFLLLFSVFSSIASAQDAQAKNPQIVWTAPCTFTLDGKPFDPDKYISKISPSDPSWTQLNYSTQAVSTSTITILECDYMRTNGMSTGASSVDALKAWLERARNAWSVYQKNKTAILKKYTYGNIKGGASGQASKDRKNADALYQEAFNVCKPFGVMPLSYARKSTQSPCMEPFMSLVFEWLNSAQRANKAVTNRMKARGSRVVNAIVFVKNLWDDAMYDFPSASGPPKHVLWNPVNGKNFLYPDIKTPHVNVILASHVPLDSNAFARGERANRSQIQWFNLIRILNVLGIVHIYGHPARLKALDIRQRGNTCAFGAQFETLLSLVMDKRLKLSEKNPIQKILIKNDLTRGYLLAYEKNPAKYRSWFDAESLAAMKDIYEYARVHDDYTYKPKLGPHGQDYSGPPSSAVVGNILIAAGVPVMRYFEEPYPQKRFAWFDKWELATWKAIYKYVHAHNRNDYSLNSTAGHFIDAQVPGLRSQNNKTGQAKVNGSFQWKSESNYQTVIKKMNAALRAGNTVDVEVSAKILWHGRDLPKQYLKGPDKAAHEVCVTSIVTFHGYVLGYYINDTGTDEGGRYVSAATFGQAVRAFNGAVVIPMLSAPKPTLTNLPSVTIYASKRG